MSATSTLRRFLCVAGAAAMLAAPGLSAAAAKPAKPAKPAAEAPPVKIAVVTLPGANEIEAPVKSFSELRFKGIVHQTLDLSCGAAALATLLHGYFGLAVDENSVIRGILASASPDDAKKIGASGFSMLELKRYAESLGLVAGGFKTNSPDDLRKLRAPVVALVNSRGYNHFVVVRHVRGDEVAIADPVFGNRIEKLPQFAKRWNGVILVAVAPGRPTNAAFMEAPKGADDPRAVQLYLSRSYSPPRTYGSGDFY